MGVEYWQCQGSYSLAGRSFTEVINGSRSLLDAGQQVQAIAVPGQPALLSTVAAVRKSQSSSGQYLAAAALGAAAVVIAAGWILFNRRRPGRRPEGQEVI